MIRRLPRALALGAVLGSLVAPPVAFGATSSACVGTRLDPSIDVRTAVASAPAGTTFCFAPGKYRITSPITPHRGQVLIGQPGTVINGAKVISGWRRAGSTWVAGGQTGGPTINLGGGYGGSYLHPLAVYSDDIYMDQQPLVRAGVRVGGRIIGQGPSAVGLGHYFYNYDTHEVVLGSNPTGHLVERAVADAGIRAAEPNISVRGLRVEMTTRGGIVTGQPNWTIQGNEVRYAHLMGIAVGPGAKVLQNFSHDNGAYGMTGSGSNILVQGNELSHNNTALYFHSSGECYDAGGAKFTLTQNLVVRNNNVHDNLCMGIWLDINNVNSLIEGNQSDRNLGHGIFHEIGYNAIIRNNRTIGNTRFGISVSSSPNDEIVGNYVADNGYGGIRLTQDNRRDWPSPSGPHVTRNTDVHHNTVVQPQGVSGPHQPASLAGTWAWANNIVFSTSNRWHDNLWSAASTTAPIFGWRNNTRVAWAAWQAAGNDPGMTLKVSSAVR